MKIQLGRFFSRHRDNPLTRHSDTPTLCHSEPFMGEESKNINFFGIAENKAATLGSLGHKGLRMTEKKEGLRMTVKECLGRSMIEMLGVLAIVGVLSIGGIALYRRAVNNHHANTILDDVNRFAFVITEKGGFPVGEDIPKGDFKESGIYMLEGHQAYGGQYSITALNVPKGICEILIDKGIVDYKVGVVTAGHDVTEEILYDTLHTDICTHDLNDVAFYFGDTSLVCNDPDESSYTPCTQNSDCCGGYFCAFQDATGYRENEKGLGKCLEIKDQNKKIQFIKGKKWVYSTEIMNWWSAQNWCAAQGLSPSTREDIGCKDVEMHEYCEDPENPDSDKNLIVFLKEKGFRQYCWLESRQNDYTAWFANFENNFVDTAVNNYLHSIHPLCH